MLGGRAVRVLLAESVWQKAIGLGTRRRMTLDGLWFRFSRLARHQVWMFGMRFPLDLVWLHRSKVVWIERNVEAPRWWWLSLIFPFYLERYRPPCYSDGIVELEAGFCTRNSVRIGDDAVVQSGVQYGS